ncbi:uncharacterized protein LOC128160759 [Crassostrea angulata]|uniref:uncharacterized protein LOC128160759 n=1 Tax=Magallana angulata TaxID=2784310 RepID=UPI0022B13C04|nr:uncharacterized protein LOC128160759 [Crassostrea angulata]
MTVLDDHSECYRHRVCNEAFPCEVCSKWSEEKRTLIRKMIERKKTEAGRKSATLKNPEVPSVGNSGNRSDNLAPTETSQNGGNLTQGSVPPQVGIFPPFMLGNFEAQWQQYQENCMKRLIDVRIKELVQDSNKQPTIDITSDVRSDRACNRFDRFRPSDDQRSRESDDDDLVSHRGETGQVLSNSLDDVIDVHEDNRSEFDNSVLGSVHTHDTDSNGSCMVYWKIFVKKVSTELNINSVDASETQSRDFKSYMSDRLIWTKSSTQQQYLPIDGYILNTLTDVDEEFQRKGAIRTYKTSDDEKYRVTSSDFDKYCTTPRLDDNIEDSSFTTGRKGNKNSYRFRNPMLHSRNNELWKIDKGSRLLLRELTYASLITSYVDNVVSDEDKTEALQALMQVFKSMADVTSRILVGAVAARRAIHIEDLAFKNKATENKLLVQTTLNPKLFCGKYFDILHASAESMCDAKETQHLRGSKQRDGSALSSAGKRKRDDSMDTSEPKEQQSSFAKKGKFAAEKNQKTTIGRGRNFNSKGSFRSQTRGSAQDRLGFRPPK